MRTTSLAASLIAIAFAAPALAEPVLMSAEWAKGACGAWNKDPVLTDKLVESDWVKNDMGRGFKVMQVYRSDCGDKPTAWMRVSLKDGKAEMGKGEYGPMKAMMFGRLGFDGPMLEAMGTMGLFESFLLPVGKVPSDITACPAK